MVTPRAECYIDRSLSLRETGLDSRAHLDEMPANARPPRRGALCYATGTVKKMSFKSCENAFGLP
jgi:hypothetical protein